MKQRTGNCDQCSATDVVIAKKLPSSGGWCVKCNASRLFARKDLLPCKKKLVKAGDSVKYLVRDLDRVFSLYIRQRDVDVDGTGKCVTCDTAVHWEDGDCGHWQLRGTFATRYREENCHLQCRICNRMKDGEYEKMGLYIMKIYGIGVFNELIALKNKPHKLEREELSKLITKYSK